MSGKIICRNPDEVLKSINAFHFVLFSEHNSDEILYGCYGGVGTTDGVSTLVWWNDNTDKRGKDIYINNGLVIYKTWPTEPSEIELIIAKSEICTQM